MLQNPTASPVASVGSPSRELLKGARYKNGIVDEIAMGEPPRLGEQTKKPLDARTLHPDRSPRLIARQKVKGCTDTDQCRSIDSSDVLRHPFLLFRHSEPDPDEIRPRLVDG